MTKQRILLVDDHEVVRLGLKALLEHHPQFEVVAEAGTAKEAIEQIQAANKSVLFTNRLVNDTIEDAKDQLFTLIKALYFQEIDAVRKQAQ